MTTAQYLNTFTVKVLRPIARSMGVASSITRKAEIIDAMVIIIDMDHEIAVKVMDDDMAVLHAEALHTNSHHSDIVVNKGWNCCQDKPDAVIVFDNGSRWVVCKRELNSWYGKVQSLPKGKAVKCECCDLIIWQAANPMDAVTDEMITKDSETIVIDTPEFPMDHAQFIVWFQRFDDFEAIDAINADHAEALIINFDAVAEARKTMNAIKSLAHKAQCTLNTISQTDARYDAAYQIWQDLARCADELTRTHYAISEGFI